MGMMGTWVSMRLTSRPSWPTMRKRMVMVGRKTFKVSQVGGLDCLSRCVSTIPPLLLPSTHPCPAAAPHAFVLTVRVAHSTLSLVLESIINSRYLRIMTKKTFGVKARLLYMQFEMNNWIVSSIVYWIDTVTILVPYSSIHWEKLTQELAVLWE